MATSNLTLFNQFVQDLAHKKHDLSSDVIKALLTNTAPSATNAVLADITEISAGNGYTTGGATLTTSSSSQTSGTYKLVLADATITASGGSIGPFRYVVVYNNTQTSPLKPLIGWYDRGSSITLTDGDSTTLDLDQAQGIFTIP